jgi:type 1 fimbria pilin
MNKCEWQAVSCGQSFRQTPSGGAGRYYAALTGGVCLLLMLSQPVQAGSSMTVTQTLTAGTCTVSSDAATNGVVLPVVNQTEFNASDIKVAKNFGQTFSVDLKCTGAPNPSDTNILKITGTADTTDGSGKLFANTSSGADAATHLGFLLINNDTDGSGVPLDSSGTVSVDVRGNGEDVDGQSVDFFVMPSKGNYAYSAVTAGTLTTTLSFDWDIR